MAFTPELWPYQMALVLFRLGRRDESAAIIREYLRDTPGDPGGGANAMQALLYADRGDTALAEQSIRRAVERGSGFGHFHHAAYAIGAAYAAMTRADEAVRWLRTAAGDGFPCYPLYERDRALDPVRRDPQFVQLMADLGKRWEHYRTLP
jgi:hypothetical protein